MIGSGIPKRPFIAALWVCCLSCLVGCARVCGPNYSRAGLKRGKGSICFTYGSGRDCDKDGAEDPPSLAHREGTWGILWNKLFGRSSMVQMKYDTVTYFGLLDRNLAPLSPKPVVINVINGRPGPGALMVTPRGFAIAYYSKYHELRCRQFDLRRMRLERSTSFCLFKGVGNGASKPAVAYHAGHTYLLDTIRPLYMEVPCSAKPRSLVLYRSSNKTLQEIVLTVDRTEAVRNHTWARWLSLHMAGRSAHLAWVERGDHKNPRALTFHYGHCPLAERKCTVRKLSLPAAPLGEYKARFVARGNSLGILLQYGNAVWHQKVGPAGRPAGVPKRLVGLGNTCTGAKAVMGCLNQDCHAFWCVADAKSNLAPYSYSTKSKRISKMKGRAFVHAIGCGGGRCLVSRNGIISFHP